MALIQCPDCGSSISDRAECCPKCARPMVRVRDSTSIKPHISIETHGTARNRFQPQVKHHRWLGILFLTALLTSTLVPSFAFWVGMSIWALCLGAFLPGVHWVSKHLLRLNPTQPWRRRFRLGVFGLIGFILITAGWINSLRNADIEQKRVAAAANTAELQRLSNQANAQIKSRVAEAELEWKGGNANRAEAILDSALQIQNATDLAAVHELRARIANAKVANLIQEAIDIVNAGDLDAAKSKIQVALAVPHASQFGAARKLETQIDLATDSTSIREILLALPADSFEEVKLSGTLPVIMQTGFKELDQRIETLAKAEAERVTKERASQEKERQASAANSHSTSPDAEASRNRSSTRSASENSLKAIVVSSRLGYFLSPEYGRNVQIVIVTLKNTGSRPIRVVDADLIYRDASGESRTHNYTIFAASDSEPGIAPGRTWTTPKGEGVIPLAHGFGEKLKSVKVQITQVLEDSGI